MSYYNEREKIDISDAEVMRLDMMVSAMWELMLDKGFTREQLNAKLDKVREQHLTLDPNKSTIVCPKCGKLIGESSKTPFGAKCLYCGHETTIYPGDSIEFNKDADPQSDSCPSAVDDLEQF